MCVKNERAVEVKDGKYSNLGDENRKHWHPSRILDELKENYEAAYVLDIDGIERNQPNINLIQKISQTMPIWLDSGPTTPMGVMDMLVVGADKVVISTRTLRDPTHIKEALDMSKNIMISIDFDEELISASQQVQEMGVSGISQEAKNAGCDTVMFFDFARLGKGTGLNRYEIGTLAQTFEKVYVAGIIEPRDVDELKSLDVTGAIVDFKKLKEWGHHE